jgi:hypothetical protein
MNDLKAFSVFAALSSKFPKLKWELDDVDAVQTSILTDLYLGEQFLIYVVLSENEGQLSLFIDLMTSKNSMYNEYSQEFYSVTIRRFDGTIEEVENYISRWLESMHLAFMFSL